jgi:hypothetical protein
MKGDLGHITREEVGFRLGANWDVKMEIPA